MGEWHGESRAWGGPPGDTSPRESGGMPPQSKFREANARGVFRLGAARPVTKQTRLVACIGRPAASESWAFHCGDQLHPIELPQFMHL